MVTIEELSIIIPVLVGVVVPIVMFFMMRGIGAMDKAGNRASMATFNIDVIKDEVKDIKDTVTDNKNHFDMKTDAMLQSIEKKDDILKADLRRIGEAIDLLSSTMRLVEYRLDTIERRGRTPI